MLNRETKISFSDCESFINQITKFYQPRDVALQRLPFLLFSGRQWICIGSRVGKLAVIKVIGIAIESPLARNLYIPYFFREH